MRPQKYACKIAYDGTKYAGYQIQSNAGSIQGELERVLEQMHDYRIRIFGSGRTDAGVHAREQVIHFTSQLNIPEKQWIKALNAQLPLDIRVWEVYRVPNDFHARYDVTQKEYRYYIDRQKVCDPQRRLYAYHIPYHLAIDNMQKAAEILVGKHDFSAFSSPKSTVDDCVRTLYGLDVQDEQNMLVIACRGDGFLYNMVRIIVGTLIEVGNGKKSVEEIPAIISKKDRYYAGPTVPAHGLCLWKVTYPISLE